MLLKNLKNEVIDGHGRELHETIRVSGCKNITIKNFVFRLKRGVHGVGDPSEQITVMDCLHPYRGRLVATTVVGAGLMDNVHIIRCHATRARLALSGDCKGWFVHGNTSIDAFDTVIYLRGCPHSVHDNMIIDAGKDAIKLTTLKDGSMGGKAENIIVGNVISGNGRYEPSTGGAINVEHINTTVEDNHITLSEGPAINSIAKGINIKAEGCEVLNNTVIYPAHWEIGKDVQPFMFKVGVSESGNIPLKINHPAL